VAPSSTTVRLVRTSSSVNRSPLVVAQSRMVKKSVDTPFTSARQFPEPPTTCVRVTITGETPAEQRRLALDRVHVVDVRRLNDCAPWLAPPVLTLPAVMTMRFVPRPLIWLLIWACAPLPIATITITAPTPMTMPSIVSACASCS
jgi:hypothetical protein